MKPRHYVLMVVDDIEPELHGPFAGAKGRDSHARKLKVKHGDRNGIYPLDVSAKGLPDVGAYAGGFFMKEEI